MNAFLFVIVDWGRGEWMKGRNRASDENILTGEEIEFFIHLCLDEISVRTIQQERERERDLRIVFFMVNS